MFDCSSLLPGVLGQVRLERVHVVNLSPISALLPGANKIKLQELAKDELLASLNEPFSKEVPEQDGTDDEKDVVDYAATEEKDEMLQLTECEF